MTDAEKHLSCMEDAELGKIAKELIDWKDTGLLDQNGSFVKLVSFVAQEYKLDAHYKYSCAESLATAEIMRRYIKYENTSNDGG